MTPVRVVFQTNSEGALAALDAVRDPLREMPGCQQCEDFQSIEFPENLLHLELWESTVAWDAAWVGLQRTAEGAALIAMWRAASAPFHAGGPHAPRRTGQNGLEFYKQARFAPVASAWAASDEGVRAQSLRWPAGGPVRIVIQITSDPDLELAGQIDNAMATRREKGCLHFEFLRSLEFRENLALIESWTSPEIYDLHWMGRLVDQGSAPAQRSAPYPRRYGSSSFEWYAQCCP